MVAEAKVDSPAMKSSISEEEQKLNPLKMISLLSVLYNIKERPPISVANTDNRIRVRDFMTDQMVFGCLRFLMIQKLDISPHLGLPFNMELG